MFEGIALPTNEGIESESSAPLHDTGNLSGTVSVGVSMPAAGDTSENVQNIHDAGTVRSTVDIPRPRRRHRRVRPDGWVLMGEVAQRMGCSLRTARTWVKEAAAPEDVMRAELKIFVRETAIPGIEDFRRRTLAVRDVEMREKQQRTRAEHRRTLGGEPDGPVR